MQSKNIAKVLINHLLFSKEMVILLKWRYCKAPQLTKTLKGIKNNGPNYFYDKLAKHLTTELNGQIDKTDFNNYKSKQKTK